MAFSMEVTDPEAVKQELAVQSQPEPEEVRQLKAAAAANAAEILALDMDAMDKRRDVLKSIDQFGMETMQTSSQKNALLQVSVGNLARMGDDGGVVSKGLLDLHREIKDLDPSAIDFAKTGLLGKLFNPIRAYFEKYQKADSVIADIVASLDKGKAMLKNDNTTLELEEGSLRQLTKKLAREIELGTAMDEALSTQLEQAKTQGILEEKARFIEEEVLFPLRQRVMDLQQMTVVNQQGIIAIEVIRRNNLELIRGVDRAKNVTISALRIATIVASALYNQKVVLKKIQLLNETTNELIAGTSKMLREQGTEIHKQAMETGVNVETLKGAFEDALAAMDAISTFKQEALPKMKGTIDQFRALAERGESEIQKLEKGSRLNTQP